MIRIIILGLSLIFFTQSSMSLVGEGLRFAQIVASRLRGVAQQIGKVGVLKAVGGLKHQDKLIAKLRAEIDEAFEVSPFIYMANNEMKHLRNIKILPQRAFPLSISRDSEGLIDGFVCLVAQKNGTLEVNFFRRARDASYMTDRAGNRLMADLSAMGERPTRSVGPNATGVSRGTAENKAELLYSNLKREEIRFLNGNFVLGKLENMTNAELSREIAFIKQSFESISNRLRVTALDERAAEALIRPLTARGRGLFGEDTAGKIASVVAEDARAAFNTGNSADYFVFIKMLQSRLKMFANLDTSGLHKVFFHTKTDDQLLPIYTVALSKHFPHGMDKVFEQGKLVLSVWIKRSGSTKELKSLDDLLREAAEILGQGSLPAKLRGSTNIHLKSLSEGSTSFTEQSIILGDLSRISEMEVIDLIAIVRRLVSETNKTQSKTFIKSF